MSTNKLNLNPEKTESSLLGMNDRKTNTSLCFLLSFSVSKLTLLNLLGILGYCLTEISPSAYMYQQSVARVFTICGICGVFAVILFLDSAKLLPTALVFSCLDYCYSPWYGIADIDLTRIQHVQNRLALIVTKSPPFSRRVPLLRSLHWLPVKFE